MIIHQGKNEAATALEKQLIEVVVERPGALEALLTCETSALSNKVEPSPVSAFLKRALQEMPEGQKAIIDLASKGVGRREIDAISKISLKREKSGFIWL